MKKNHIVLCKEFASLEVDTAIKDLHEEQGGWHQDTTVV